MRKISYNDVQKVIKQLRSHWLKEHHLLPQFINSGNCDTFASEISMALNKIGRHSGQEMWGEDYPELFPKGVDCGGHCFFFFEKRFFDAECISGVESPHLLPYYQRQLTFHENCKKRMIEYRSIRFMPMKRVVA